MQAVVLFARSPEREAIAKQMAGAVPLFRAVVAAWLREAEAHGARPVIACEPRDRDALAAIAPEVPRDWIEQPRAAFGERVCSATCEAFARGFASVVIAAIDAPPPRRLGEALAALANGVEVIGPARDGGVNFIGITRAARELLANLTFARCRAALPHALIFEAATDVDSPSALHVARTEKCWSGYIPPQPTTSIPYIPHVLRGVCRPLASRPPPQV
ncbi:MAG TPA: DUF2064 domain-containing protein [Thermoanaerobaculia bacterium]|nr:DUF2064 domain-containing protein [Thermoanaerobaculia bacterium]